MLQIFDRFVFIPWKYPFFYENYFLCYFHSTAIALHQSSKFIFKGPYPNVYGYALQKFPVSLSFESFLVDYNVEYM